MRHSLIVSPVLGAPQEWSLWVPDQQRQRAGL